MGVKKSLASLVMAGAMAFNSIPLQADELVKRPKPPIAKQVLPDKTHSDDGSDLEGDSIEEQLSSSKPKEWKLNIGAVLGNNPIGTNDKNNSDEASSKIPFQMYIGDGNGVHLVKLPIPDANAKIQSPVSFFSYNPDKNKLTPSDYKQTADDDLIKIIDSLEIKNRHSGLAQLGLAFGLGGIALGLSDASVHNKENQSVSGALIGASTVSLLAAIYVFGDTHGQLGAKGFVNRHIANRSLDEKIDIANTIISNYNSQISKFNGLVNADKQRIMDEEAKKVQKLHEERAKSYFVLDVASSLLSLPEDSLDFVSKKVRLTTSALSDEIHNLRSRGLEFDAKEYDEKSHALFKKAESLRKNADSNSKKAKLWKSKIDTLSANFIDVPCADAFGIARIIEYLDESYKSALESENFSTLAKEHATSLELIAGKNASFSKKQKPFVAAKNEIQYTFDSGILPEAHYDSFMKDLDSLARTFACSEDADERKTLLDEKEAILSKFDRTLYQTTLESYLDGLRDYDQKRTHEYEVRVNEVRDLSNGAKHIELKIINTPQFKEPQITFKSYVLAYDKASYSWNVASPVTIRSDSLSDIEFEQSLDELQKSLDKIAKKADGAVKKGARKLGEYKREFQKGYLGE